MKYRVAEILAEKTLNASGTEVIPVNVVDPISRIDLLFQVNKGEAGAMSGHPAKDISKIELVDGSDVLHCLSGYENQALAIYNRKVSTMLFGETLHNNPIYSAYGIDFGRKLWDTELALDPKQFRNLQLKVTYTSTEVSAAGTTPKLKVVGHMFDEKVVNPIGFLMAKEFINEATPANDAFKYVDLPTDHLVRQLLLRGYYDGVYVDGAVEGLRLSEDNEKRIPFDWNIVDYCRIMRGIWKPVQEMLYGYAAPTDGDIFYVTPTDYHVTVAAVPVDGGDTIAQTTSTGGKVTMEGGYFHAVVQGWEPNNCIQFPFGDQQDLDDWYDVTRLGSLRARVRGSDCGTTCEYQLVLEQLRRYGA